jgi:hypothetical protein
MSEEIIANVETPTTPPASSPEGGGSNNGTELIAGKYKTQEDLNKGILSLLQKQHGDNLVDYYKHLESELGSTHNKEGGTNNDNTDVDNNTVSNNGTDSTTHDNKDGAGNNTSDTADLVVNPDSVDEFVSKLGLNYKAMEADFNVNGSLSPEHYQLLANKGIPKQMVDNYLMLINDYKDNQYKTIAAEVGGEDALNTVFTWVGETYSPEEISTYNKLMGSGDIGVIKNTIKVLAGAYKEANGSAPEVNVTGSNISTGTTFKTFAEYTTALAKAQRSGDKNAVAEVNAAMYRSRKGKGWK